jgi:hypothetical protein
MQHPKLFSIFVLWFSWSLNFELILFWNSVSAQQGTILHTNATLSEARWLSAATSSGDLVFFAGGFNATGPSDRVDICNATNGSWTTASLSVPRGALAATSSGNLVFFGGGWNWTNPFAEVDIYNITDGSWNTATLNQARFDLAATSVGDLVLFGGGYNGTVYSNVVDIYNVTSNTWTTATLSQARYLLAAASVANRYALFAGGWDGSNFSNIVDIFDLVSGLWNTTTLSQARMYLEGTSLDNLVFFGGGYTTNQVSNVVDIFNSTSQTWNTATLSQARYVFAAAASGDIVAFGGGINSASYLSTADMYNVTSNNWFIASLSMARSALGATSSSNKVFFGGGYSSAFSNKVDIFDIPPLPMSVSPGSVSSARINSVLIGGIIGGLIGAVLLVGGIVVLILLILQKKRKNQKSKTESYKEKLPVEEKKRETIILESIVDMNTLKETNTALTTYQPRTEALREQSPAQIPLNELDIHKEIGEGTYGRVCIGKWKKYRVALKFCQNKGKMDEFMRETNLMISLPPHPNVVRVYGISMDGTQPIIVMEYCAGGSLDKLLFDARQRISDEQKIRWVHEIALGLCHLHKHNIVHRDLAARNILFSHLNPNDAQLKISDFGMSRVLEPTVSEGKTLNGVGPLFWMSPEALANKVYSKKSDVWMFGMLVYEIAARRVPFGDKDPLNISTRIRDEGLTPTIPKDCPAVLRDVMQMCWEKEPEQRPTMEVVLAFLEGTTFKAEARQSSGE